MPAPVDTKAGKVLRLAAMRSPPFPTLSLECGVAKAELELGIVGEEGETVNCGVGDEKLLG